jgi:hypothetical protein
LSERIVDDAVIDFPRKYDLLGACCWRNRRPSG